MQSGDRPARVRRVQRPVSDGAFTSRQIPTEGALRKTTCDALARASRQTRRSLLRGTCRGRPGATDRRGRWVHEGRLLRMKRSARGRVTLRGRRRPQGARSPRRDAVRLSTTGARSSLHGDAPRTAPTSERTSAASERRSSHAGRTACVSRAQRRARLTERADHTATAQCRSRTIQPRSRRAGALRHPRDRARRAPKKQGPQRWGPRGRHRPSARRPPKRARRGQSPALDTRADSRRARRTRSRGTFAPRRAGSRDGCEARRRPRQQTSRDPSPRVTVVTERGNCFSR